MSLRMLAVNRQYITDKDQFLNTIVTDLTRTL